MLGAETVVRIAPNAIANKVDVIGVLSVGLAEHCVSSTLCELCDVPAMFRRRD